MRTYLGSDLGLILTLSILAERNSEHLQFILDFSPRSPLTWVLDRFPLLSPIKFLFFPWRAYTAFQRSSKAQFSERLKRRDGTGHLDYVQVLLGGAVAPTNPDQIASIAAAARQLVFTHFQSSSDRLYFLLFHLANEPDVYATLVSEIRATFATYEDITTEAPAALPYVSACLREALRLYPGNNSGLPRISPGAMVDGTYVPKGVS